MGKYCENSKNLLYLKKLIRKKQLFTKNLKNRVFVTILEIFKNAVRRNFLHCFSSQTRKKCRIHKVMIRNLLDSRTKLMERKQLFQNSSKKFKTLVVKHMLPDFWKNCVEKCA